MDLYLLLKSGDEVIPGFESGTVKIQSRVATIALLFAMHCGAAELSFTGAASSGVPNQALTVNLTSTGAVPASSLTGVQFDLTYDTTALDVTVNLGAAAEGAGKTITTAPVGTRGLRVIIIGFNQIGLTDGPVAIVHVTGKNGAAPAAGMRIRLAAPVGTTRDGTPVAVALREPERTVR